jgi:tetratricopeptide (TPR) repeat protein
MRSYSVRDVERVLNLSRSTIRGLIASGLVAPRRGARHEYRFSFQDLIALRAARALIQAAVPHKRIRRSLASLRRHLPSSVPLSGLSICAVGDRVVVRNGKDCWQAEDGQYLLGLEVSVAGDVLKVEEHPAARSSPAAVPCADPPRPEQDAAQWFAKALELEGSEPRAAIEAYERAVQLDPRHAAAWINRGRLLHEQGAAMDAEHVYRSAIEHCGPDPLLMFNLAVLLEDRGEGLAALAAYQTAVSGDPELADAHYNLARLYQSRGELKQSLRHLQAYRRLSARDSR